MLYATYDICMLIYAYDVYVSEIYNNLKKDEPISNLRGGIIIFSSNFNRTFRKQAVKILIRHRIILCLV